MAGQAAAEGGIIDFAENSTGAWPELWFLGTEI